MALHGAEHIARRELPRLQGLMATRWWGPAIEGIGLGVIVATAIAVSGSGGEFIYFQF